MSHRQHSDEPREADHESAFFLSECDALRSTMDPLELLILCEEAEDDMTVEYLLATISRH